MQETFEQLQKRCGLNLRHVREEKSMSIEALAVLSGIDQDELRDIEAGTNNVYITTIFRLACELNVDFRRILIDHAYQKQ